MKKILFGTAAVILLALVGFYVLNTYVYNEKQSDELTREQKEEMVSGYIETNISTLSPESEVLGGTFYVTDITFHDANSGVVAYEDGHIALTADFVYSVDKDGNVEVTLTNAQEPTP